MLRLFYQLTVVCGLALTIWSFAHWANAGFIIAERGNPKQLEDGLFVLGVLLGLGVTFYGLWELMVTRK